MYNVLIVDDEPIVVKALNRPSFWDDFGLEVIGEASNGKEALEIIEREKVHILITDIRMPLMDGIELIKQIRERKLNIRIIILSGYDDFTYVKEAVKLGVENYLLKPLDKSEFSSTIQNTVNNLQADFNRQLKMAEQLDVFRENLLSRWVSNSISKREFLEKAKVANINTEWDVFSIVILKVLNKNGMPEKYDSSAVLMDCFRKEFYNNISENIFYDASCDIVAIFSEEPLKNAKEELIEHLRTFILRASSMFKLDLLITIGNTVAEVSDAYKSYYSAKELQAYSFLLPPNSIIDAERVTRSSVDRKEYSKINYNVLTNLLIMKKKEECFEYVRNIFENLRNESGITPFIFKNTVLEILFHISNTIKNIIASPEDIPDEIKYLYIRFENVTNFDELVNLVYYTLSHAFECLESMEDSTNSIIKQILEYVKQNLGMDLSLKSLSFKFNINASYLGQLFKKETGVMFSIYLNNLRIEKSKDLLSNTDIKVAEVSEKVGYLDPSHFYKLFKNATGLSPAEYKEKMSRQS